MANFRASSLTYSVKAKLLPTTPLLWFSSAPSLVASPEPSPRPASKSTTRSAAPHFTMISCIFAFFFSLMIRFLSASKKLLSSSHIISDWVMHVLNSRSTSGAELLNPKRQFVINPALASPLVMLYLSSPSMSPATNLLTCSISLWIRASKNLLVSKLTSSILIAFCFLPFFFFFFAFLLLPSDMPLFFPCFVPNFSTSFTRSLNSSIICVLMYSLDWTAQAYSLFNFLAASFSQLSSSSSSSFMEYLLSGGKLPELEAVFPEFGEVDEKKLNLLDMLLFVSETAVISLSLMDPVVSSSSVHVCNTPNTKQQPPRTFL
mmetsp:Transcript_1664/g.3014  ORF Transcript_1664/g.3014 Transcript_1664/m.3014 type:complete len:318 (+) Transcript_1664:3126-4079(+)